MDVFNADAFSFTSLSKSVDLMGFIPGMTRQYFDSSPVRTKSVWIERRGYQAAMIQTSPRGAPPSQVGSDSRDARAFNTVRLAQSTRIYAEELQFIRRFGSEIDQKDLADEINRRTFKLRSNMELTMENMRLGVLTQGKTLDADGSTIYDWTAEFASEPSGARSTAAITEVAFNFAAALIDVRQHCASIIRSITRNLQGLGGPNPKIIGFAGDSFYDQLCASAEVRQSFLNWEAATALRDSVGSPWMPFNYGGIFFVNYRGTDDTSLSGTKSVGIATASCKFFPATAGIFQTAYAPGEKFEFVGSPGQEMYSQIVRDVQRDEWADVEVKSYPLPVCVLPDALASGRAGA